MIKITITLDDAEQGMASPSVCVLEALHEAEQQGLIEAAMNIKVEENVCISS